MSRDVKPRCNGRWSEAQYLSFLRSTLRGKFLRYPVRDDALKANRVPYEGDDSRTRWIYTCELCKQPFKSKEIEVDHFPRSAGSLSKLEDLPKFAENLFCELDNLRILCIECHKIHTYASKEGVSFEKARKMKEAIAFGKLPVKEQIERLEAIGVNIKLVKNADHRRAAYLEWLEKKDE